LFISRTIQLRIRGLFVPAFWPKNSKSVFSKSSSVMGPTPTPMDPFS
jgi:hypothetical protein